MRSIKNMYLLKYEEDFFFTFLAFHWGHREPEPHPLRSLSTHSLAWEPQRYSRFITWSSLYVRNLSRSRSLPLLRPRVHRVSESIVWVVLEGHARRRVPLGVLLPEAFLGVGPEPQFLAFAKFHQ